MNRELISFVLALGVIPTAVAQNNVNGVLVQQQPAVESVLPALPLELTLRDGTPVRMRLTRTLSSEQVKTGDKIDFEVLDDVNVGGRTIIARGSSAIGAVTETEHKRRMGRGGKLNLALDYVRLEDGTKVALRGERDTKGGGHVGAMTAGMTAAVVLGFGLPAPLFLFMHGKEAVVPMGSEMTAYVNGDTHVALWR